MGGACCTPEVEKDRAEIAKHQDVESLLLDMQRYKTSNAGSTDMKLLKRSKATRTKIAAFKERMSKRPEHLRSLTPAFSETIDSGNDTVDGEPPRPPGVSPTAVYGHTKFDRSSADRFMKFKEKADHEMKRRSANPEDDAPKKGKGKKVKKGRRDDEDKKKTKKKSKEVPEVEEPKKKKKKKKQKN